MGSTLSDLEKSILAVLQKGLPLTLTPYRDMAGEIGIEPEQLLEVLRQWDADGKLRRIGAVVSHVKVGLSAGSMVVWEVEPSRSEEVGRILASFAQVSHAYQRPTSPSWRYNLYTMVHGADSGEVDRTVRRMSKACGVKTYCQLHTKRELKKVPPTYIMDR
ncbi:MAG: Lrp/AsnC family transcriptional regulator [Planctomycetota bacterium]|nr:MAG: Lrp/AsnC family transcriptional regulator [Planctomycetota bacterium]